MKKIACVLVFALLMSTSLFAVNQGEDAKKDITKLVKNCYFNGAFNGLDTKAMKKGFHSDFAVYSKDGKKVEKFTISKWIETIEKNKNSKGFNPDKVKALCKIVELDVTGDAATVKAEIYKNQKKVYTDYLSLIRSDDGWKIISKVYHNHIGN
ncbi:nuclear transport factor 2 family protein [candidate division KSB1 bacterium]